MLWPSQPGAPGRSALLACSLALFAGGWPHDALAGATSNGKAAQLRAEPQTWQDPPRVLAEWPAGPFAGHILGHGGVWMTMPGPLRQAIVQSLLSLDAQPWQRSAVPWSAAAEAGTASFFQTARPVVVMGGAFDPSHVGHWLVMLATIKHLAPLAGAYMLPMATLPGKQLSRHEERVELLRQDLHRLQQAAERGGAGLGRKASLLRPYLSVLDHAQIKVLEDPRIGAYTPAGFDRLMQHLSVIHPGSRPVIASGVDGYVSAARAGSIDRGRGFFNCEFAVVPRGTAGLRGLESLPAAQRRGLRRVPVHKTVDHSSTGIRQAIAAGRRPSGLLGPAVAH